MPVIDVNGSDAEKLLAEYEHFVAHSPYGHMMQSVNWAKVKDNWSADYVYLRGDDGEIAAGMSIISISNDGGESAFLYAPRGPVCDFRDLGLVERLVEEATPVVEKRHGFVLRIDPEMAYTAPELPERIRAVPWNDGAFVLRTMEETDAHAFSQPPMNMVADLVGKDADTVLETYPSKTRGKIRKPFKSGISTSSVTVADTDFSAALDAFYELTGVMAERQGITHRPREYFERLLYAFPGARLYITKHESGEVLASSIVVNYNRKAFYMYAASSNEMRNLRPNDQMNFVAIQDAIRSGMNEYDMGGIFMADDADGLYSFKKQFCGAEGLRSMVGELDLIFDAAKYREFVS
ncbi:MAG: peptidoglycan bridge formation glycyltransferase FemA/FemB family protein [Actinomycetaceae bacterium]|nr:aminoacyltransferase [Arcanobacterium sp.]MDD7505188.1 peptidoglycan bridge formation glycyltransferase FemA/FemB family protein [Actinomycetaceae bacterium]MDY6144077.1 peptidoglycan bridge formation glycyltransferase FemA/FemB family protein [Arcanobacterium sp.]